MRPNGITVASFVPFGVTQRDFCPSTVSVLIDASDWSPTTIWRSTVKFTFAEVPASSTSPTLPTLMPATRTSLPGVMPPASPKNAE
ncbi:hypothetical protein MAUB1S_01338 [Mycolicibacterium aubagnense]